MPFLLAVCAAIEEFTAAATARDPEVFRPRGVDLCYVVERHHYFAMVNDEGLYRLFVAKREGTPCPRRLPAMAENFAPYLVKGWRPRGHWRRKLLRGWRGPRWRASRDQFRKQGAAKVRAEDILPGAPVLFLAVQAKFVRFLLPIAEALGRPYAFVAFEDPEVYAYLEKENLPRIHVTFDDPTRELLKVEEFGLLEFYSTYLNAVVSALKALDPPCIVVPEGNSPLNELFNRAGHTLSIPTACIQQGWSPVVHNGFRNMSFDRMCVWGNGFAELLAPFNPNQKFVATGNHLVAPRPRGDDRENGPIAFFLQAGGSPLITQAAASALLELVVWAAERFPNRQIRVREHPNAPLAREDLARLAGAANVRLMPSRDASLEQVMAGCDIAVSIFSSTILEAAAAGIIPLIVNVAGLPHYSPDIARDGAAIEVKDFEMARAALVRLDEDLDYAASLAAALDTVKTRYFARDALPAIVAEIQNLCTGVPPG